MAETQHDAATMQHDEDVDGEHVKGAEPVALPAQETPIRNGHDTSSQVEQLQKQLAAMQVELQAKSENGSADAEVAQLREQLAETERERDDVKDQLEGFLSKISSMKTVFRNYKATQEELEEVKLAMAALADEKEALETQKEAWDAERAQSDAALQKATAEKDKLASTVKQLQSESADLNSECDRLSEQLTTLRREYQNKDESLQDEKYSLENEVSRLTKKLSEQKASYGELELAQEEISMENKNLALVIEELKGRMESQDAEIEKYKTHIEQLTQQWDERQRALEADAASKDQEVVRLTKLLETATTEKDEALRTCEEKSAEIARLGEDSKKIAALQEEVHSKQLIIGKLRHEAIILNEHLTKSLLMLKQQLSSSNNTVDRELISNVFLNFLQIPRGDTKKFEALLLISALLEWDETRKVQAGLVHSVGAGRSDDGRPLRLSFVSLWTDFLEKESSKK